MHWSLGWRIRRVIRCCAAPIRPRCVPGLADDHFADAPVPPTGAGGARAAGDSRIGVAGDLEDDLLRTMTLLAGVPDRTILAVRARAVHVDVSAGAEVVRRWDSDRFFYIILSGGYDVFIDGRPIRTLGPGDHFGELAARDWGGGYGYARLATVRCPKPAGCSGSPARTFSGW
jgi:hypothetical protein